MTLAITHGTPGTPSSVLPTQLLPGPREPIAQPPNNWDDYSNAGPDVYWRDPAHASSPAARGELTTGRRSSTHADVTHRQAPMEDRRYENEVPGWGAWP